MNLSIVVPVYNEEQAVLRTLFALKGQLRGHYEIIVVDDYSSDKTREVIQGAFRDFKNLRLIENCYTKGFGKTLKTGLQAARHEIVIPVMADFCDEISLIPRMHEKIIEGYDVVNASRYTSGGERTGGPALKAFLSRFINKLLHKTTGIPATDTTNAFKAYRKSIFRDIAIESDSFEISTEIILKAYFKGFKIAEIPTKWRERTIGQSHFGIFNDGIKFIRWFIVALTRLSLNSR